MVYNFFTTHLRETYGTDTRGLDGILLFRCTPCIYSTQIDEWCNRQPHNDARFHHSLLISPHALHPQQSIVMVSIVLNYA